MPRSYTSLASACLALCLVLLLMPAQAKAASIKHQQYIRTDNGLNISITYPVLEGMSDKAIEEAINALIRQHAGLNHVEKDIAEGLQELETDYDASIEGKVLMLRFDGYAYYTGAAHPNDFIEDLNISLQTSLEVRLQDVMVPGFSAELDPMVVTGLKQSDYCGGDVFEIPSMDGERYFSVKDGNLLLGFQKYEIAPGACGSYRLALPLDQVRHLIRPDGPLGHLAR